MLEGDYDKGGSLRAETIGRRNARRVITAADAKDEKKCCDMESKTRERKLKKDKG